jgi:probable HAF family extracellular repeat protein
VATAVSTDGTIVGYSEIGPSLTVTHAFLRPAGGGPLQDLGTLGGANSQALAINDAGFVVGWSELFSGQRRAAYRNGGALADLNALLPGGSGWTLLEARGVNNAGQVVGVGILAGDTLAYLLSPASLTGVGDGRTGIAFAGAFPNPVRDRTQFAIATATEGHAQLELFDVTGRSVRTLVDGRLGPGRHTIAWDGRGHSGEPLPAGLYLARFASGSGPSVTRRVSLVR